MSFIRKFKGQCLLGGGSMYPRHFQILSKTIANLRKNLQSPDTIIFKINVKLETFKFKEGLQFNLITLQKKERSSEKIHSMFRLGAKKLNSELGDLLLTSPEKLTQLSKKFKN